MKNGTGALRVLLAEAPKEFQEQCERFLKPFGIAVRAIAKNEAAVTPAEPAIVLVDLDAPGQDGLAELSRSAMDGGAVVALTGDPSVEKAVEAMRRGACDVVLKPFTAERLHRAVEEAAEALWCGPARSPKRNFSYVFKSMSIGTLVTDTTGKVTWMNPALQRALRLPGGTKTGAAIDAYLPERPLCALIRDISKGKHVDYEDLGAYEFSTSDGRWLLTRGHPVVGEKNECLGAVVSFLDISARKRLERLKTEYAAKVSHELRSPLSTIHEQLALVIQELQEETGGAAHPVLMRAKEKTKGLIALIGDLLDLARIEEGVICNRPRPVALERLLADIVAFLETQSRSKHQTLKLRLPEEPLPAVMADPIALESIFGNLITNAITYTPEGGTIEVTVDRTAMNARVRVSDNGFGIEAKHIERIFERFYRVKNDRTRYITGTGLGLPIVKELVDSLGGFIEVDSTHGRGSTFIVLLPAGDAGPAG